MRPSRIARQLVLAAIAVALVAAPAAAKWPSRKVGGDLIVETPHYSIRTDLGEEIGQEVGNQQETLFRELYRRMGKMKNVRIDDRMKILVVRSYRRYLNELGPAVVGSRGVFMPTKNVLAVWAEPDQEEIILETLRHEGTHQFVYHFIGQECPIWLNEGLAVFYEHAEFVGGRLDVGQVVPRRLQIIRKAMAEDDLIALSEMLSMSHREWLGRVNSGDPRGYLQYCQAWAMVHFLAYAEDAKYQKAFLRYIYRLTRGQNSLAAWAKTFGSNYAAFQKRWTEYVETLRPGGAQLCRMRMEFLARLVMTAHRRGKKDMLADAETFRKALLEGKLGTWNARLPDGTKVASDDPDTLATVFLCPDEKDANATTSFTFREPDETGDPPTVVCEKHRGRVHEVVYVKDENGKITDVEVAVSRKRRR